MHDCTDLLKGSIRTAHEISQLLRPTLLDDFGLDCALAWLCEKFEERHRIKVKYTSDFRWRLDGQAETQGFSDRSGSIDERCQTFGGYRRIGFVLETGWNCAAEHQRRRKRLGPRLRRDNPPLGLTGMKARAHSLGGELTIESSPARGVSIELVFRARAPA